ncbi:type II secretion system F family protein [Nostocoides sp. F2B08]|uniref:type II secretion system F family protein n=1 Tax=Nostocoides sp. F2B08 TaxID=2653936 RepID=UPI00186B3F70|nr:type II secretion system F family protein [Tetrasphaera sp. F2B08]
MTRLVLGLMLLVAGTALWPGGARAPRAGRMTWEGSHRSWRRHRQGDGAATDVALAAQLLVVALRTGLPVVAALERVAEHSGPQVAADLHRVLRGYGHNPDEPALAWASAPDIWRPVCTALTVAAQAGVHPGPLLATAARDMLRREGEAHEAAIGRVSVRLVLPLGLVLLPAFMCTTVLPLVLVMTRRQLTG